MKSSTLSLGVLALAACTPDTQITEQRRALDSFPYVDCGAIAPGDRQVCTVPLFSKEDGAVTIYDIRSVDVKVPPGAESETGAFIVRPEEWDDGSCDEEVCRALEGYDDTSDADTLALPVTFAPLVEGEYQAELTIWSNDNETTVEQAMVDEPDRTEPVWKVQLRGLARPACGRVWPAFRDMGLHSAPSAEFSTTATIENCGIVTLIVASFTETGTGIEEMSVTTPTPLYVLPGLSEEVAVNWTVGALTDGQPTPVGTDFGFVSNATDTLDTTVLTVIGNDCSDSVLASWDADADGWTTCGGDCDDTNGATSPSAIERGDNAEDDDCDGEIDEAPNAVSSDDDGDGWSENDGDCHDADAAVSPAAAEVVDQIDNDCNGLVDDGTANYDDDQDGYSEREGDVDDTNRLVYPGASETVDGLDNDGDGTVDEGGPSHDDDQDGFIDSGDPVADDCDDEDPWVYVGAYEYCDGYDNDCDGTADEGEDDTPDGACAFLPEREEAVVTEKDTACASAGGATGSAFALTAALLAIGLRRRAPRRR